MTEKVFKRHAVGKPLSQSSFCSNPDEEQSAAAKGSFQDNQPDYEKIRFWRVLLITWMGYAAYVIARKPFSVVRIEVEKEIKMTTMMSSMVDTAFLTTYCFGQIFYSVLKSRCSSKIIIGVGLAGAASCTFLFSSSSNSYFMILLWGLNGIFESFGWPSCVSVVTPWLHPKERGRLMGIWGSCQAVGSLLGNWLVASLLMIGWRQSYVGVTVVVVIVAVLIFFYLYEHPNRAGFVSPLQWSKGVRSSDLTGDCTMDGEFIISEGLPMEKSENTEVELNQITTMQLAKLPAVPDLAMSYFCQKLIRYSLLSWLPYYLTNELGFPPVVAGYVASSFDFGGIIGSIASGLFSDWYKGGTRRVQACVIYLKCGTASLLLFSVMKGWMASSVFLTCTISAMVGFFFFGCDTLMTGATLQDLAERLEIPAHAGSISGFVGGIGSIGAILQGPVTAYLATNYGWSSVFYFLIVLSGIAIAAMYRPAMFEKRFGATNPTKGDEE